METKTAKRGKGRPTRGFATKRVNMFLDESLYNFAVSQKGGMTLTEYISSLIRKDAENSI